MPTITVAHVNERVTDDLSINDLEALLRNKKITDETRAKIKTWLKEKELQLAKDVKVWMYAFNVKHKKLSRIAMYYSIRKGERYFIIDKVTPSKRVLEYNTDEYTMGECCAHLLQCMCEVRTQIVDYAKDWGCKVDFKGQSLDEWIDSMYLNIEEDLIKQGEE
jgi:hypothetical protein